MSEFNLPGKCTLQKFGNDRTGFDFLMVGADLDRARFDEIKKSLPIDVQDQLIGWKRLIKP